MGWIHEQTQNADNVNFAIQYIKRFLAILTLPPGLYTCLFGKLVMEEGLHDSSISLQDTELSFSLEQLWSSNS